MKNASIEVVQVVICDINCSTIPETESQLPNRKANFPKNFTLGSSFLCRVLSISGQNITSRPGIRVNTESRLQTIDFISTIAISKPKENCMKASASNPLIVVREDAKISGIALLKAATAASLAFFVSCSSVKR